MRGTVRLVPDRLRPAEEEDRTAGISNRPPAGAAAQFEQCATLPKRNSRIEERILDIGSRVSHPGWYRPLHAPMLDAAISGCTLGPPENFFGCTPSAGRTTVGGKFGNAEPTNLCGHCVGADATAQFLGNLPHAGALQPSLSQIFGALIRPLRARVSARCSRHAA